MKNITHLILTSIFGILLSTAVGCKPDLEVFERPATLAGPIYQQLQELGDYGFYLACLDRTDYAEALMTGGSWTVFVPNDSAFASYLEENGYGSVAEMPLTKVNDIVKYSIVIDSYNMDILTYYPNGWYTGNSFRKLTQYEDPLVIYKGSDNSTMDGIDITKDYLVDDSKGRTKTNAYWIDAYTDDPKNDIYRSDYPFMFTGEDIPEVGDMKVFGAHVVEQEIIAENGMIYALDEVIEPQPTQYQNLTSEEYNGKYSIFKSLLDRFATLKYIEVVDNPYTGGRDSSYQVRISTGVTDNLPAFDPSDESYPKLTNNVDRTQASATGLLVPTNEALEKYLIESNTVSDIYSSYEDMPLDVVALLINVNFFTNYWEVCPSHFGESYNVGLENVVMAETDVVETKFCSNGLFVGVNKIYPCDAFATVYGPTVLDSSYSIMLDAISYLGLDNALQGYGKHYNIFALSNDQFVNIPDPNHATRLITVVDVTEEYTYVKFTNDPATTEDLILPTLVNGVADATELALVKQTLSDIVLNQIIDEDISEDNFYETMKGEFVYVEDGAILRGGGDFYDETSTNVLETKFMANGEFHTTDKFIPNSKYFTYLNLLLDPDDAYEDFFDLLDASDVFGTISGSNLDFLIKFLNLTKTYTCLAPSNEAIAQAIADGAIPDPASVAGMEDELEKSTALANLQNFAKRHFIQQAITTNGKTAGEFSSLEQIGEVDFAPVYSTYQIDNSFETSKLTIKDISTQAIIAETVDGKVNLLTKGVVVHSIDTYLPKVEL